MVIFTLVFGTIVTTTMTGMDYLNRLLFILKIGAFGGMALWLLPKVSPDLLATSETQGTFQAWHLAIPIVFTSFGFHGSIPSLMNYLGMNRRHLKIAFLVGSLIPLLVYILWLSITIGTITPDTFTAIIAKGGDLGSLVTALNDASGSQGISVFTDVFAGIGVITSYMGVGIGVVDFYKERLKVSSIQKPLSGLLTFFIPLLFGTLYPQGFIAALGYAAIALSLLAVILPTMIAIKTKQETKQSTSAINLYLLLATGIGIIVLEIFHITTIGS
jgi:tyrosine-specific transport protein